MADKKKGRKRKEEFKPLGEKDQDKPTKEEYTIAKWLRKNVPTKKTKFLNHNVEYFTGCKAVDALMESQWAKPVKEGDTPLFASRGRCTQYLNNMLIHKFYHRAKKIPVSEEELKARKKGDKKAKSEKENTDVDEKKDTGKLTDSEKKGDKSDADTKPVSEKKKRKIRLEMHLLQCFEDGRDAYVWIYDPVPVYYWFFGTLLVLGGIVVCLFPLWPPSVRLGVYYLSLTAIGFLCLFIGLVVLQFLIFCTLWLLTLGKHHLWILPNLIEDVGLVASFWPLYHYEYKGGNQDDKKDKKKKKKKDKDSDADDDGDTQQNVEETNIEDKVPYDERNSESEVLRNENSSPEDRRISESESESSQRSSTGRDFEIVEKEDVEAST